MSCSITHEFFLQRKNLPQLHKKCFDFFYEFIGDAKYDMLLQRIGSNTERAFIRKAVGASTTISSGGVDGGGRRNSVVAAAAQNPLTNNMVDHHWKANQGGSLLEAIDVEETHRTWLTAVANMYTPPLDVVTIKCLVLANGSAVILGIQDSSMTLLGESQEDDRRLFCEIAYEKMAQFVLRRRESSAAGGGPAAGNATPKLLPQQRQQSIVGRPGEVPQQPPTAAAGRQYGGAAATIANADVVAGQSTARNVTGTGQQGSLSSFVSSSLYFLIIVFCGDFIFLNKKFKKN